jgi:hypothetical protein
MMSLMRAVIGLRNVSLNKIIHSTICLSFLWTLIQKSLPDRTPKWLPCRHDAPRFYRIYKECMKCGPLSHNYSTALSGRRLQTQYGFQFASTIPTRMKHGSVLLSQEKDWGNRSGPCIIKSCKSSEDSGDGTQYLGGDEGEGGTIFREWASLRLVPPCIQIPYSTSVLTSLLQIWI